MMKNDNQKIDTFLHEEGLLDAIDEQRIYRAVMSKSPHPKSEGSNKVGSVLLVLLFMFVLVGFTSFPYLSKIIDDYFGANFSTLLTTKEESSVTKKGITIRLHHYFQDNGLYYSVVSVDGADQSVGIDSESIPGVSMVREITPEEEQTKQYFVLISPDKLSALKINALQTTPITINEQIKMSSIQDLATNRYEQISRQSIVRSTGVEEAIDQLMILDGAHQTLASSVTPSVAIDSFGVIQDQFHIQLQSLHKSIDNLVVSVGRDQQTMHPFSMSYLFDYYHGGTKSYRKEFVFADVKNSDAVDEITISGDMFTDSVSADWIFDVGVAEPLPMKVFESSDGMVSISVSPLSIRIDTSNTQRLKGTTIIAQDTKGNQKKLAILDQSNSQGSTDAMYITYYNDLDTIQTVIIGDEVLEQVAD